MPALQIGKHSHSLNHAIQAASLLGILVGERVESVRVGWDIQRILWSWIQCLADLSWASMLEPTPSRGRSVRKLAVNSFLPIGLLQAAWHQRTFTWPGDPRSGKVGMASLVAYEEVIEDDLTGRDSVLGFAHSVHTAWTDFLLAHEAELADIDPVVTTPGGELTYSRLLESQRTHAAYHLRQVLVHLRDSGAGSPGLQIEALEGIRLPHETF